jgi:hypothetical protein
MLSPEFLLGGLLIQGQEVLATMALGDPVIQGQGGTGKGCPDICTKCK